MSASCPPAPSAASPAASPKPAARPRAAASPAYAGIVVPGSPAPDREIPATHGPLSLSALRGKWVVLYFYPRDHTPGCTTESADFGTHHAEFAALGAVVAGVSRDTLASHQRFADKLALPFTLASDTNEALCLAWDVMRDKVMYGKPVRGIERSTFLIDPDGVIREAWRGVKVPGHVAAVLTALRGYCSAPG